MDYSAFTLFCLDYVAEFCRSSFGPANMVGATLLTLANSFATASGWCSSEICRSSSSAIRFPTPTIVILGVLDEASQRDKFASEQNTKGRYQKGTIPADLPIRSLETVLSILRRACLNYTFSEATKIYVADSVKYMLNSSDIVGCMQYVMRFDVASHVEPIPNRIRSFRRQILDLGLGWRAAEVILIYKGNFSIGLLSTLSLGNTAVSRTVLQSLLPWVWLYSPDGRWNTAKAN